MERVLLSGRANRPLAGAVAAALGLDVTECVVEDFPDGEIQVRVLSEVRDAHVILVQPTSPPVGQHLLELALLGDACRRAGARRITAAIPYFGYARQDRRTAAGEPVGARVVADLLHTRVDQAVVVDLHEPSLEGLFPVVEHLSAISVLAESLQPVPDRCVVVAPDLGAAKRAQEFGRLLELPVAYVHKVRRGGSEVLAREVVGEVRDRKAILVDDMISTGGTLVSAAEALLARGCLPPLWIAATHGPLLATAVERLSMLPVERIVVTDSMRHPPSTRAVVQVAGLAPLLAEGIRRAAAG